MKPFNHFVFVVCSLCIHFGLSKNSNLEYYKNMEKIMDTKVNPCLDFYQYACGNWQQVHNSKEYYDVLSYIDHRTNMQFMNILRRLQKEPEGMKAPDVEYKPNYVDNKFVQNLLNYFQSCSTVGTYDPTKYLGWMEMYERIAWPRLNKVTHKPGHKTQNYDWVKLLAQLRKYQLNGIFIEEIVLPTVIDAMKIGIDIDKPELNGGFKPLSEQNWDSIVKSLNLQQMESTIQKLWDSLVEFEEKLLQLANNHWGDDEPVSISVNEFDHPWLKYYVHYLLEGLDMSSVVITINNIEYMTALDELLSKIDEEFIASYLQIRFLWHLRETLPTDFNQMECVLHMRGMFPLAMDWLFEQDRLDLYKESDFIVDMFHEIKGKFHIVLHRHAERLPPETVTFLFEKLDDMMIKINNLPRFNSSIRLEIYYQYLSLNQLDFYNNHLTMLKFRFEKMHERLFISLPSTHNEYYYEEKFGAPITSAPFYINRANTVIVPLSLLQYPLYQADLSELFKYSGIGFLLAHEIVHGFDETSLNSDKLDETQSLAEQVLQDFTVERNLNCLTLQFPNGTDEKIADFNGLPLSQVTFFDGTHMPNDTLADLGIESELNKLQMFFVNFAQYFCSKPDPNDNNDPISYHRRVNDMLANYEVFGKAFHCRRGSRMRSLHKCRLWA